MNFWESKLSGKFLNIEYEKLVKEPKNEIKNFRILRIRLGGKLFKFF